MKDGFIKVAAATPEVTVADCKQNAQTILQRIHNLSQQGVKIMVFPELCLTGYSCRDLFLQQELIDVAAEQLGNILDATSDVDALIFLGLPCEVSGKLYNVAAVLNRGRLLGLVPKKNLPNYNEFYERRQFTPGQEAVEYVSFRGEQVPFGLNLLFACRQMPRLVAAAELCEDLWVPNPPSTNHAMAGATVIANLSASNDMTGKAGYRRMLVASQSGSLIAAYIYASIGEGESTTDLVFGGHDMIAENGTMLAEAKPFSGKDVISEIDVNRLAAERRRTSTYPVGSRENYVIVPFSLEVEETKLTRTFSRYPFVPEDAAVREARCEEILTIQSMGLVKRLAHIHAKTVVIGISGGLDSTLALLVAVRAFDTLQMDRSGIIAVTMPGFGTTDRTYTNACTLVQTLGATLKEVPIAAAVTQHFADIGQDPAVHDVTYENCQARERTQILMDIANRLGGIVIGTGDLSELALGWATYNGDHMSMYAVNVSIPKTLVRYLVRYEADTCEAGERRVTSGVNASEEDGKTAGGTEQKTNVGGHSQAALRQTLLDILDTPVSPELLPPEKNGEIAQKTEDLVGPYELHDFFLYYMLRAGFPPKKIYRIACRTFAGAYDHATILKWSKNFYRRFFSQQFKRSCMPDGPKVGSVALSPRGDLRMPSDACARIWLDELEEIKA